MLLINILAFVGGLILLVKGADLFVEASTLIAKRFGVSEFVIGLTLVSLGTSVPELASSLTASFQQASGIIIGNILGSNIANIGLIASTAALLSNVRTEELTLRRDGYIMLFSSFLLFLFVLDFNISRIEALILLLLYVVYLLFLLDKAKKHEENMYFKDFLVYFFKFEYLFDLKARIEIGVLRQGGENEIFELTKKGNGRIGENNKKELIITSENKGIDIDFEAEDLSESSLFMEFFKLMISGAAIIIGAKYFVEQAIFFALLLKVPETLIGLSLVAVGTSVPELMVTVSAARSGYSSIAIGNVIGSNIANILLILGCSGLVNPLTISRLSTYYIVPFMLFISALFLLFIRTGWRIKRFEGLILLLLYSGFMVLIFRLG
ncbi:MAG: calcium/sodium antiporter [Alphaproteobacteria bacterium]|nr:MAG: calcium/sodium antiporter [Alphaproteobacteria bacterium]